MVQYVLWIVWIYFFIQNNIFLNENIYVHLWSRLQALIHLIHSIPLPHTLKANLHSSYAMTGWLLITATYINLNEFKSFIGLLDMNFRAVEGVNPVGYFSTFVGRNLTELGTNTFGAISVILFIGRVYQPRYEAIRKNLWIMKPKYCDVHLFWRFLYFHPYRFYYFSRRSINLALTEILL